MGESNNNSERSHLLYSYDEVGSSSARVLGRRLCRVEDQVRQGWPEGSQRLEGPQPQAEAGQEVVQGGPGLRQRTGRQGRVPARRPRRKGQGENLHMAGPWIWSYSDGSTKKEAQDVKAEAAVQDWYNEKTTKEQCMGHYTQVVWKASKKFCMAKAESETKNVYTVARYYPRGNFYMAGHKLEAWQENVDAGFQFPDGC